MADSAPPRLHPDSELVCRTFLDQWTAAESTHSMLRETSTPLQHIVLLVVMVMDDAANAQTTFCPVLRLDCPRQFRLSLDTFVYELVPERMRIDTLATGLQQHIVTCLSRETASDDELRCIIAAEYHGALHVMLVEVKVPDLAPPVAHSELN